MYAALFGITQDPSGNPYIVTNLVPLSLGCNNLVTIYGLPEGCCVIPTKVAYMDGETWENVVKLLTPGIRKMKVSNFACVFPILISIYITLHLCPSKSSSDDLGYLKVLGIPHIGWL